MNLKSLVRRKPMERLQGGDGSGGPGLKRVLGARDVFVAGVGAAIGAGIFVLTGTAAAQHAGPGLVISFMVAAVACALVAFAYAELASMIPRAGSAYTYSYHTLGEVFAWLIGWDLLLEYGVGSSAVAVGWSAYLQAILKGWGIEMPAALASAPEHVPWISLGLAVALLLSGGYVLDKTRQSMKKAITPISIMTGLSGLGLSIYGLVEGYDVVASLTSIDILAVGIIVLINILLVLGVKIAARATGILVLVQMVVIIGFIALGVGHIDMANFSPFLPFGWSGVVTGAAIVFFAFIGFDMVTTLSEECKNPESDMPKGIISSLFVCTGLYIIMAAVMVGCVAYTSLNTAAPVATVLEAIGSSWAVPIISVGALAGITSTLLVLLLGQSRVMMTMSQDGLMPKELGKVSPTFHTPVRSILILGTLVSITAGLLPIGELAELCNIGTLAAFVVVCLGVIVLRYTAPDRPRKFRCPGTPWLPALGALFSVGLMLSLPMVTWIRFVVWMVLGIGIYLSYGRYNSVENDHDESGK